MDNSKVAYLIIKQKDETAVGSEVIEVVKGEAYAIDLARRYDEKLTPQERTEGWSHFASRTNRLKPGADPAMATKMWLIDCGIGPGAAHHPISRLRN